MYVATTKTEKSTSSNISRQITEDCSPNHLLKYKHGETERERVNLREKPEIKALKGFVASPSLEKKLKQKENENNLNFKINLRCKLLIQFD